MKTSSSTSAHPDVNDSDPLALFFSCWQRPASKESNTIIIINTVPIVRSGTGYRGTAFRSAGIGAPVPITAPAMYAPVPVTGVPPPAQRE